MCVLWVVSQLKSLLLHILVVGFDKTIKIEKVILKC